MANYYPVSPRFWPAARRADWDNEVRLLALYLLTCEHRNLEGLYRLPLAYVAADLGWPLDRVGQAMHILEDEAFVAYDTEAEVVFVRKALKWHQPKSEKQIAGAINSLRQVPETPLLWDLAESADTHSEGFAKALREAFEWVCDDANKPIRNSACAHNSNSNSNSNSTSTTPPADSRSGDTPQEGPSAGLFKQVIADLERRAV